MQSVEEILRCYSKDRNPHHNRQIKFIMEQLNSGQSTHICGIECYWSKPFQKHPLFQITSLLEFVAFFSAQEQGPESDTEVEEEYAVSPDGVR